ncbi:MAG: hypothetical protein ACLFQL_08220 [Paracoccaceae bacterium]
MEAEIAQLKARQAAKSKPAPDIPALFARAVEDLEALLGSPDTVAQANEHLSVLIRRVTLTPDPEAEGGLAIDIETDLDALRIATGIGDGA